MLKLDARGKKVLFISDTHIPYSVAGYFRFLKKLKETFKPDLVIHVGDEVDGHAISFHKSHAELYSAGHELDKAIIELQEGLHQLFPKLYLLESNHGSLIYRRMKDQGIPIRHLKPLHDLYETPRWSWHEEILLRTNQGPVYICHGKLGGYMAMVREMGVSCVQGHFHGKLEITTVTTSIGKRFNMFVGCLVDTDSLAMAYGKLHTKKPALGTGGIKANGEPILFPYKDYIPNETTPNRHHPGTEVQGQDLEL